MLFYFHDDYFYNIKLDFKPVADVLVLLEPAH